MYKLVKVNFPFVEKPKEFKSRPVLLLTYPTGKYNLSLGAFVTSKIPDKILETDIFLDAKKYGELGLKLNSIIRLHKISSICNDFVEGEYGDLPDILVQEIKTKLKAYLNIF